MFQKEDTMWLKMVKIWREHFFIAYFWTWRWDAKFINTWNSRQKNILKHFNKYNKAYIDISRIFFLKYKDINLCKILYSHILGYLPRWSDIPQDQTEKGSKNGYKIFKKIKAKKSNKNYDDKKPKNS